MPESRSTPCEGADGSLSQSEDGRQGSATPRSAVAVAASDVLALIPTSARRLLDIGCGSGELGAALRGRQPVEVVGWEPDREWAQLARPRLDHVLVDDVETLEPPFADRPFDCILCCDLLPCLRDPPQFLQRVRRWLAPDGRLIIGFPNARHHRVLGSLLDGRWTAPNDHPRSRTPIRYFTRREVEKLCFRAQFDIAELRPQASPGLAEWQRQGCSGQVRIGRLHIGGLSAEEAEEFYAERYVVRAQPRTQEPGRGLTSIVIVTHNQLSYTRQCVDSIRLFTDEPYELICVDNGSSDGTVDYFRSSPGVTLIANADNRGFPAAVNQGIRAAKGRQVLLLNNDCVVTTGWLCRLLQALHSDPQVGLAGPCSNRISGEQQVPVRYDEDLVGLDGFAWEWGKAHDRQQQNTDRLVGFCLLIRREVIDAIGLLDEQFGIGCFEDDDYCLRALRASFRAVIARAAFVHHYGSQTFRSSGVNFGDLLARNQQLFRAKWQAESQSSGAVVLDQPTAGSHSAKGRYSVRRMPGGGLLLERTHVHLSLCMIVRNNARTLAACLESIRPWVDEMVIVDTGSTDDTPQIVERFGGRLFHFPWCDSFSAARNESLRHARGKWIFWMDSDDTISPANGRKLRDLAYASTPASVIGYVMQVHCPGPGDDGAVHVTVVDHVKLFRNLPELRFEGRIHEQILPAIRRAGGETAWTDVFVTHSGYDHSPEGQAQKVERDLRLLHLELQEQPEHPFTLFNLGMTYADQGKHERAIDYLQQSLAHAGPGESHLRKVYALLVCSYSQLGRSQLAWETCQQGLQRFPQDAELRFRQALLLQESGRLTEAARVYEELLTDPGERHFSSLDRGITGFKARQNLAVVYVELGDFARSEEQWRQVVAELPHYRDGWRGLGEVLLRQRHYAEAESLAHQLSQDARLRAEGMLLNGQIAAARGDVSLARQALEAAAAQAPQELEPLRSLCRVLFEQGDPGEAARALERLLERDPQDPAAHFNLGTIYLRFGRHRDAVGAYERSLALRPNWPPTYLHLGHALKACGDREQAIRAWHRARELDPRNSEIETTLRETCDTTSSVPVR